MTFAARRSRVQAKCGVLGWRVVVKLLFGLQALRRRGAGEVCRFLYSRTTSPFNENRIATTSLISVWS